MAYAIVLTIFGMIGMFFPMITKELKLTSEPDWSDNGMKKALKECNKKLTNNSSSLFPKYLTVKNELDLTEPSDLYEIIDFKTRARKGMELSSRFVRVYIDYYVIIKGLNIILTEESLKSKVAPINTTIHTKAIQNINELLEFANNYRYEDDVELGDRIMKHHKEFFDDRSVHAVIHMIKTVEAELRTTFNKDMQSNVNDLIRYQLTLNTDESKKLYTSAFKLLHMYAHFDESLKPDILDNVLGVIEYLKSEYNRTVNVGHPSFMQNKLSISDNYITSVINNDNWVE